jgi:hypothetical protein
MKKTLLIIVALLTFQGCTPHLGKDIFVSIDKNDVKIENTKTELTLTALSFVGAPVDKSPIKLRGYLTVENRWWKSIKVKSIKYSVLQNDEILAKGNANINKDITIDSDEIKKIPLSLVLDTKIITATKMLKRLANVDIMEIEGTVTVEVFGKEFVTEFRNKINKG